MKWISVKDRLPQERDHYLIFKSSKCEICNLSIKPHAHRMGWPTPRMYVAWFDTQDNTWAEFEDCNEDLITYWMPLPKMPKQ
jgi:hypothetical protein